MIITYCQYIELRHLSQVGTAYIDLIFTPISCFLWDKIWESKNSLVSTRKPWDLITAESTTQLEGDQFPSYTRGEWEGLVAALVLIVV